MSFQTCYFRSRGVGDIRRTSPRNMPTSQRRHRTDPSACPGVASGFYGPKSSHGYNLDTMHCIPFAHDVTFKYGGEVVVWQQYQLVNCTHYELKKVGDNRKFAFLVIHVLYIVTFNRLLQIQSELIRLRRALCSFIGEIGTNCTPGSAIKSLRAQFLLKCAVLYLNSEIDL